MTLSNLLLNISGITYREGSYHDLIIGDPLMYTMDWIEAQHCDCYFLYLLCDCFHYHSLISFQCLLYSVFSIRWIWSRTHSCSSSSGMLQADPGIIRDRPQIFRLFVHETQRVFHDRLINSEDKMFFHQIMAEMASKHFGEVTYFYIDWSFCDSILVNDFSRVRTLYLPVNLFTFD